MHPSQPQGPVSTARMRRALCQFLAALDDRLALAAGSLPAFRDALASLPAATPARAPEQSKEALPVLRHWPGALAGAGAIDPHLAKGLGELAPHLRWRQNPNYVRRPPGPGFLDDYGYAVIAGPGGLVEAPFALGVLVLGPGVLYPAHAHPAEEVYVVLDPASAWWRDGEEWRSGINGAVIHHPPHIAHAMRAGAVPLCALYLWRGDLATHAEIVSD